MISKILISISILALVTLLIILNIISPTQSGPLGIFFVFVLMYLSILGILTVLLFNASNIFKHLTSKLHFTRPISTLSLLRSYYFASVLSLIPVIIIGMQSIGRVGLYEISLVAVFAFIACFYIYRRTI